MSEPGLSRSHYLQPLHRHLKERGGHHEGPRVAPEPLNVTGFKRAIGEQFSVELATADAFTDDRFIAGLVELANDEGLTNEHIRSAITWVKAQLSEQANTEMRQEYVGDIKHAKQSKEVMLALAMMARKNVKEIGATVGLGMTSDVIERKKQILGLTEDQYMDDAAERAAAVKRAQTEMRTLVRSGLQREINKQRYRNYVEIGGAEFTNVLREYQSGKMTLRAFMDHPAFMAGLNKLERELVIPDDFEIKKCEGDSVVTEIIDAREPNVKAAIRRQMKWVAFEEIPVLAEIDQMELISSPSVRAEAISEIPNSWERAKAYTKSIGVAVGVSGTTWGAGTRTLTKLLVGGLLATHYPAALGIGAGLATGVAAGMAAGYVRDRYFTSAERRNQQRMDAAVGAIDDGVVKSAEQLHNDLVDQTAVVQALQESIAAGEDKTAELDAAIKELYRKIVEVRVRLLRASVGNDAPLHYPEEPEAAAAVHTTPTGHGVGFGRSHRGSHAAPVGHGVGRGTHAAGGHGASTGHGHAAIDHNWKPTRHGERQDYISFGVANRLESQHRLMEAYGSALAVVNSMRRAYPDKVAGWVKDFDQIERAENVKLDEAQDKLEALMASHDRWALGRAVFISGLGGAIGVVVADAIGAAWEKVQPMVTTLLGTNTEAIITNGTTDVAARFTADGTVSLQKAGVELAQTKLPLPAGVTPQDVTLQFEDGDLTVYEAASGRELGILDLTVEKVIEGEVVRPVVAEVNFAVGQNFPLAVDGQTYALVSYANGMVGVVHMVDGVPKPVGDAVSVVHDTLLAKLEDAPTALQFNVTPTADGAIIKSAIDSNNVLVLHLPKIVAGGTTAGPSVEMTPLTPERVFVPVGLEHGAIDFDTTIMGQTDPAFAIANGMVLGAGVETLAHQFTPKPEIARQYHDKKTPYKPLVDQPGFNEYDPDSTTDYPDAVLPPISATVAVIEEERLLATRVERSVALVPVLATKLSSFRERIKDAKSYSALIENIQRKGRAEREDFAAAVRLMQVVNEAKVFLATKDGDLDYAAIDAAHHENGLHNFIAGIDVAADKVALRAVLIDSYRLHIQKTAGEVEHLRTRDDKDRTPDLRLSDLRQKQAELLEVKASFDGVAGLLAVNDAALPGEVAAAERIFAKAIAPLQIFMRVQVNPDLRKVFDAALRKAGLLDAADPKLNGVDATLSFLTKLAADLLAEPAGERGMQGLGLLGLTTPKFAKKQADRINQIITDLLAGAPDYLAKGRVDLPPEIVASAPVVGTAAVPDRRSAPAARAAPDAAKSKPAETGSAGADDDAGVDMGDLDL